MAAAKTKSTKKSEPSKAPKKTTSTKVAAAIIVDHPRVARAKRLGVYHLHTTKAGGVTQSVQEASARAYEVMEAERKTRTDDATEKK